MTLFAAAVVAFGVWFASFALLEAFDCRARREHRAFPWRDLLALRHAGWLTALVAIAAAFSALGVSGAVLVGVAVAYGIAWGYQDRSSLRTRLASWPDRDDTWLRAGSVAVFWTAHVAYGLGVALIAVAIVEALDG